MPVVFDSTPATAAPSIAATAGASGRTPAAGSIDFLALLANLNALAATALASTGTPAETSFAPPTTPPTAPPTAQPTVPPTALATVPPIALPTVPPETAGLPEPGQEYESRTDQTDDTPEDDEPITALILAGLPVAVPAPQAAPARPVAPPEQGAEYSGGDSTIEALLAGSNGNSSSGHTLHARNPPLAPDPAASTVAQALVQSLLPDPVATPQTSDVLPGTEDPSASTDLSAAVNTQSSTSSTAATPLHTLAAHAQAAVDSAPREIRAPVGTHAWTRQLGDEIAWMMQQGKDAASLKLSPEHLGPLEVRISMSDSGASVWFGATQADTRSALEQTLPRLREMFASQGLALADAGVFKEAPRQQPRAVSFNAKTSAVDAAAEASPISRSAVRGIRLLDTYA